MDEAFLSRVYRTSLWLTAWLVVWLALSKGGRYIPGLSAGLAVGMLSLWSIERMVRALQPVASGRLTRRKMAATLLVKYAVLAALLWALIGCAGVSAGAFLVGATMPIFVIVLKAVGHLLTVPHTGHRGVIGGWAKHRKEL